MFTVKFVGYKNSKETTGGGIEFYVLFKGAEAIGEWKANNSGGVKTLNLNKQKYRTCDV